MMGTSFLLSCWLVRGFRRWSFNLKCLFPLSSALSICVVVLTNSWKKQRLNEDGESGALLL